MGGGYSNLGSTSSPGFTLIPREPLPTPPQPLQKALLLPVSHTQVGWAFFVPLGGRGKEVKNGIAQKWPKLTTS